MFTKTVQSKKKIESRKKARHRWFWGVLITTITVFIGVVVLINQPFSRIGTLQIVGNETVNEEDIITAVGEVIHTKAILVFPRDTVLFYPRKKIRAHIFNSFSRLQDVSFDTKNFDLLTVSVEEHQPEFLWCGKTVESSVDTLSSCYYMDKESYVFSEAPYFSDHVFLKFTGSHNEVAEDPIRTYIFETTSFEQLLELRTLLQDRGIEVNKISAEMYEDYKLDIDTIDGVRVGPTTHLLVNFSDTNQAIVENLQVAFETDAFAKKLEAYPELLEYIDLRFPEKIVYRFKSGAPDLGSQ